MKEEEFILKVQEIKAFCKENVLDKECNNNCPMYKVDYNGNSYCAIANPWFWDLE